MPAIRWRPVAFCLSFVVGLVLIQIWDGPATRAGVPLQTIPPTPSPTPDLPDFGLAFVNSAEQPSRASRIQRAVDLGAQMDRFPLYWDRIERSPGEFDWSRQDAVIQADEAQGLQVLGLLLGTPASYWPGRTTYRPTPRVGGSWLRARSEGRRAEGCVLGQGPPPPQGLYNPVFDDDSDVPGPDKSINPSNPWARFVYQAVSRYRPGGVAGTQVRFWEIWNEPDLCAFWSGTPQDYARLLKVAYLAARHADPEAYIIWGGLAHFENGQWLYDMLEALFADPMAQEFDGFFDAAGSHHYSLSYLGYQYTAKVRAALARYGAEDKPIWITESGVPVCDDYPGPPCPSPWRATPEEQAAYIWQNIAYTRLAGGGPILHFMLHDDCGNVIAADSPDGFGLFKNESDSFCSPAQAEPRLAATAYRLAVQYLSDVELLWGDIAAGARRVAFFDPASRERRLLTWAVRTEPVQARIPAAGTQATAVYLDGREETLTPTEGAYVLELPGATNRNWPNDQGGYDVGIWGEPVLLIEEDTLPPVASMEPLPTYSPPAIPVQWQVVDWGSGVLSATLWVQVDEEPWRPWQVDIPGTGTRIYSGEPGRRYRFAVTAVDRLGHRLEGMSPLAWTEVPVNSQVTGRVVDPAGGPVAGATVQIGPVATETDAGGVFTATVPTGNWDVSVEETLLHRGRAFAVRDELMLLYAAEGNRVRNGSFEQGWEGWRTQGSSPARIERQPNTQDHALRLATEFVPNPGVPGEDGSDGGNSTAFQRLTVPEVAPYLAFAYRVQSQESEPGHDFFEVIVARDGLPADYLIRQSETSPWRYRFIDLGPYAGQEITLIFNVYETSPRRRTTAWVDMVTVASVPSAVRSWIYMPVVQR